MSTNAKHHFTPILKSNHVLQSLSSIDFAVNNDNNFDINIMINNFTNVIVDAAKDTLSMRRKKVKQKRMKIKPKNWYDKSC